MSGFRIFSLSPIEERNIWLLLLHREPLLTSRPWFLLLRRLFNSWCFRCRANHERMKLKELRLRQATESEAKNSQQVPSIKLTMDFSKFAAK